MYFIKEIPQSERPREKLIQNGVEGLTNIELLAIILKNGTKNKSVIEISKELIYSIDDINALKDLSIKDLIKYEGIGMVKAIEIVASIELGRRVLAYRNRDISFKTANDVFLYLKEYQHKSQEHFIALYLDSKCQLISKKLIYIGTQNKILFNTTDILKEAIRLSSVGIIIAHNHPSGDPTPSKEDIKNTLMINDACKIMQIELLDHIIIGNTYYSFGENGKIA